MNKYLCLQRTLPDAAKAQEPSPQEMQDMYEAFKVWQDKFKQNIVDIGGQLGKGKIVSSNTIDGPFVEIKEIAGGYMILETDSLEAAETIVRELPGLVSPYSGCEVIEIVTE